MTPRDTAGGAVTVLACALAMVALSPSPATASCGSVRDLVAPGASAPSEECVTAAIGGALAAGTVAVAFVVVLAGYVRGALPAEELAAIMRGVARGRDEPDLIPTRRTDVPGALVPAVAAALDCCIHAFAAHEELGLRSWRRFTKAFAAGVGLTISGCPAPAGQSIVAAQPADVARYAASINHTLPPAPRPFLDRAAGGRGMWYASHAEKQQLYLHRDAPLGITSSMCPDCYEFFRNAAVHDPAITGPLVAADPEIIRVFHTDGSIDGYWHDGTRAPHTAPQYLDVLRAHDLIG